MNYLTFIAAVIVVIYTVVMCIKNKGIPESLSQTAFFLSTKAKWLFGAVMIVCGVLLGIVMIDKSSENTQFLAFLTLVSLCGVGVTPLFNIDTRKAHYVFAIAGGILPSLCIVFNNPLCLLPWFGYVFYTLLTDDKSETFWSETACFVSILLYCIF
jgi:hypothetical protein